MPVIFFFFFLPTENLALQRSDDLQEHQNDYCISHFDIFVPLVFHVDFQCLHPTTSI